MDAARSQSALTAGTLSASIHIALIAAAVSATRSVVAPPKSMPAPIRWTVTVPSPVSHGASAHGGTGTGSVPAAPTTPGPISFEGALPDPLPLAGVQPGGPLAPSMPGLGLPTTSGLPSLVLPDIEGRGPEAVYLPAPDYPASAPIREPGAIDSVIVEYLITAAGRVDPAQINVVISTNGVFAAAVREVLARARFLGATGVSGPVPALARQVFRFIRK